MTKIVRTPTFAGGGITEEERAQFAKVTEFWTANAFRTDPVDPERLTAAIKSLYAAADLKEPRVVIVPSPRVMATAGTIAADVWAKRKATGVATGDATYDATLAATLAATRAATRVATGDATLAATYSATRDATSAATYDATSDATSAIKFCNWWKFYQGGNMWSAWCAYLSGARDVLGLRLPEHEKYKAWEQCAIEGGFRFIHAEFCLVSDRPKTLKIDTANRPHCEDGPSHEWRDGWKLYYWHGMKVPDELIYVIEQPELITIEKINAQKNTELKRIMVEKFGHQRYLHESNAIKVDECPADHPMIGMRTAALYRIGDMFLLDLLNSTPEPDGTIKRYTIPIRGEAYGGDAGRNCIAASASTWRKRRNPEELEFDDWRDYQPVFES